MPVQSCDIEYDSSNPSQILGSVFELDVEVLMKLRQQYEDMLVEVTAFEVTRLLVNRRVAGISDSVDMFLHIRDVHILS